MRSAVSLMVCMLASGVAAAQQAAAPGSAAESAEAPSVGPRYRLEAQLDAHYSSNLFLEQTRRLPLFATERDLGERYAGMGGPSDFATVPGLEAGVAWKLGHGRKLAFALGAEYAIHLRNSIANYLTLAAGARYAFGKRDRLSYRAELIPSRFKRNYPYAEAAGQSFFDRADYLQLENELSYRHGWSKRWHSELGIELELRRFEAPFENRDYNAYTATFATAYAPVRALEIELGIDAGVTLTPREPELDSYAVDRSRSDLEPHLQLSFDLPHGFDAALGLAVRVRTYLTREAADGAHFDRHDRRLSFEAEAGKSFGKRFRLALYGGYADSNAYRADPSSEPNLYGYEEAQVGLLLGLIAD